VIKYQFTQHYEVEYSDTVDCGYRDIGCFYCTAQSVKNKKAALKEMFSNVLFKQIRYIKNA